jgi:hypothetical protein
VDLDDCLIHSEFALGFLKVLEINEIIQPATYDKISSSHGEYMNIPSKQAYGKIVDGIIDATGQILQGASARKLNDLAEEYAAGSKAYWMPYTAELLGLISNTHHYKKSILTAMPQELAYPVSMIIGVNKKCVYPTAYQTNKGKYSGEIENAYASNGSKKIKADKIINSFHDPGLKERTLVIDNAAYGPFESAGWGILLNFSGELPDNLQEMKTQEKLLVCSPKDNVIKMAKPFLRKVDEEIRSYYS